MDVPLAAGIGKPWRIGKVGLPLNTQLVPFDNVVTPDFGPDWQLRFQFLFRAERRGRGAAGRPVRAAVARDGKRERFPRCNVRWQWRRPPPWELPAEGERKR